MRCSTTRRTRTPGSSWPPSRARASSSRRDRRRTHRGRHVLNRHVFRSGAATIAALIAAVVAVWLLVDAVVRAGWAEALLLAPWVLLVAWVVYAVVYVPAVITEPEGLTVVNVLRCVRIPWGEVESIDLRYQLVVGLADGTVVKAYGGPAAGRPARPRRGDATRQDPPAVRDLILIRERWDAARERGAARGPVTRSWDFPSLVALGAIAVWALVAVLIR